MARLFKIASLIVLAVVILLVSAVVIITRVIDPNDFKPQIQEAARTQANLDVAIPGQLDWSFWPNLGITTGRIEVRLADDAALFAGLDSAAISVAVWPLLFGDVRMDGISIAGLEANLLETAQGANWEQIGTATGDADTAQTEDTQAQEESGALDIPLVIPLVSITDSRVHYRNDLDGTDITVEQFNLEATDVSLDQPFPLAISMQYQDQSNIRLNVDAALSVAADLNANRYQARSLVLNLKAAGVTGNPVDVRLSADIDADLESDSISVQPLELSAAGATLKGHIGISQLSAKPVLAGSLASNRFNLHSLLATLGEAPIETANSEALTSVGVALTLSGPENTVMADPLSLFVDGSTVSGRAGITNLDTLALVFDLELDKLTIDDYLPPTSATTDTATASNAPSSTALLPPLSTAPLLPLDSIRSLVLNGEFRAGQLGYDSLSLNQLKVRMTAKDGLVAVPSLQVSTLEGGATGSAELDARTDIPSMKGALSLTQMQIQPLVQIALEEDLFTGIVDSRASFKASGNSEKALADSLTAKVDFALARGTLRGVNLHNSLLTGINDLLGAYQGLATMIPGQESGRLPKELSEDTEVVQLNASARVEKLVAHVDTLSAELRRGTLSGQGMANLRSEDFDFRFGMKSPQLTDNRYLRDQTWPMRCKGNLAGEASEWCGHDKEGFREIGKKVAAQVAKDKVKDKLGIDAEGDTTEEVIKNAAEDKAKEELNKKVEEGLKKLFR